MVNTVWLGFILIGISLFFTAYYFRRQSKRLNSALSSLYELNQNCNQDALDFFDQAWKVLQSVGCERLQANIEWFGERKSVIQGTSVKARLVSKSYLVSREDMRFEMIVFMKRGASQHESVSSLVIKTFLNVLEQDLVLKQAEILTSQKRLERYQLFVQHEIKNIAQFIQLLSEQVNTVDTDENKVKLVNRLYGTLPIMAKRARKTVEHMQQPLSEFYEGHVETIKDLLIDVAQMYSLEVEIEGNVSTNLPKQILVEVFKNILGNFRDHPSSNKPIQISIIQETLADSVKINILSEKVSDEVLMPERMFEPFWSTSESGMGLGLFLSRELLKQLDAQIHFYQSVEENQFGFLIELPGLVTIKK